MAIVPVDAAPIDIDGAVDYNVCLVHDWNGGPDRYSTWYVRDDLWPDATTFMTFYQAAFGPLSSADYWEDSVFEAQGAGNDYTWAGSLDVAAGLISPPFLANGLGMSGIMLTSATDVTVIDNTIVENDGSGVFLRSIADSSVGQNRIRDNAGSRGSGIG